MKKTSGCVSSSIMRRTRPSGSWTGSQNPRYQVKLNRAANESSSDDGEELKLKCVWSSTGVTIHRFSTQHRFHNPIATMLKPFTRIFHVRKRVLEEERIRLLVSAVTAEKRWLLSLSTRCYHLSQNYHFKSKSTKQGRDDRTANRWMPVPTDRFPLQIKKRLGWLSS